MKWLVLFALIPVQSFAWGKRGHALVAEAAAYTLKKEAPFLRDHSFDMAYYANVPDLIWRRPATNKIERDEHYVDLEILDRAMGKDGVWSADREQFFKRYPEARKAGNAFWRVQELCEDLGKTQQLLLEQKQKQNHNQFGLQARWLMLAGVLGHYVADLSQPLHTTENHDGQLSDQKGIHSFYETALVNELYPEIAEDIFEAAQKKYTALISKKSLSCFDLARGLAGVAHAKLPELLKKDKDVGRSDLSRAANGHEDLIVENMSEGAAYLALMWSQHLGWAYHGKDFWNFDESPKYVKPKGTKR